jgi:hypothetical protein
VQFVPAARSSGDWYERLEDVSDDAVIGYLDRAFSARSPAGFEGDLWNGEWIGPETTQADSGAGVRHDDDAESAAPWRG